jgi:hypothetical protein
VVTLVLPEQRRDMTKLMSNAGIRPTTTKVRPGDAELTRITGARTPSGVAVTLAPPVVAAEPAAAAPKTGSGGGNRRRSGPRSGLPADVDINGNPKRRRPKQRIGGGAATGTATSGGRQMAAGFIGKASGAPKAGSGSKSGSNYGTGRQRRAAR